MDFIVKPVQYYDFSFRIQRAIQRLKQKATKFIMVKTSDGNSKLNISLIKYVEVMNHKMIYHSEEGDFESYGTLKTRKK